MADSYLDDFRAGDDYFAEVHTRGVNRRGATVIELERSLLIVRA